jgi:hypothetical protein
MGEILCAGDDGVDVMVVVRDVGNDAGVPAIAYIRVRPAS